MQILSIGDGIGEQRVSIRLRAGGKGAADRARPSRPVLDHEILSDPLLQHRREYAHRHVGQAARGERDDEGDRTGSGSSAAAQSPSRSCRPKECQATAGKGADASSCVAPSTRIVGIYCRYLLNADWRAEASPLHRAAHLPSAEPRCQNAHVHGHKQFATWRAHDRQERLPRWSRCSRSSSARGGSNSRRA